MVSSLAFQLFTVLAQDAADGGKSAISSLILIPVMIVMIYFLVIRPQQKEEKKRKEMIASLAKGDSVVTSSGIHGKIIEFRDNNETVVLNISKDTNVTFNSSSIVKKK
ncbi:MAG: preprotein translocase subunit YajC [Leptospiraceae bacterium]|nr:preprotein translocase subunit YajC [Leptospiraceae bacterium]